MTYDNLEDFKSYIIKYTDLDETRGHQDDVRGYHYHVDYAGTNNFINGLRGVYALDGE